MICGADNWVAIEEFGKARERWFSDLLDLKNGIPSHDTFGDVFAAIDTDFASSLSPPAAVVTYDGGHGRVETRAVRATSDIAWVKKSHDWPGLQSLLAVTATRESGDKVPAETRYFVSSLTADEPEKLEHAVIRGG